MRGICFRKKRLNRLSAHFTAAALAPARQRLRQLSRLIAGGHSTAAGTEKIVTQLLHNSSGPSSKSIFSGALNTDEGVLRIIFEDCGDIRYRRFRTAGRQALAVFLDGMTDSQRIDNLLSQLIQAGSVPENARLISELILPSASVSLTVKVEDAAADVMRGNVLLLVDGLGQAILADLKKYVKRPVEESKQEGVLRGPYDAFTETLIDNTTLLRRRSDDTDIKIHYLSIGVRTRTQVAVIYAKSLAKRSVVDEVISRLERVKIDKLLYSGTLEEFLTDHPWSPFPFTQPTERPDKTLAAIYDGRVAILVDNTPWAVLVPCTYNHLMQSPDDYTTQPAIASFIRFTRHVSAFIATFLPGAYVAVTSYHPGILPGPFALTIAELRVRAPFPAFLEAFVMEGILEIFQEAITRLPQKIVVAASVVGGFVIGTTVVEAGIINPLLVVVIATTAIASYSIPSYALSLSLRWLRVPTIILASVFGLYGLVISVLVILTHMCAIRNFGEAYLGELFNPGMLQDWKDMLVRFPARSLRTRPKVFGAADRIRTDNDGQT